MFSGLTSVGCVNIYHNSGIQLGVGLGVEVGDMGVYLCDSCHPACVGHRGTVQCRGRTHG